MLTILAPMLMKLFPSMVLDKAKKLSKFVLIAFGIVIIVVSFLVWLNGIKNEAVQDERLRVESLGSEARDIAADERLDDAIANMKSEEGLQNAIREAPKGGTVSPAAHALNCERLFRQSGRVPAGC